MKVALKECTKPKFIIEDKECSECESNLECFNLLRKELNCIKNKTDFDIDLTICHKNGCSYYQREFCKNLNKIEQNKKLVCEFFSEPKITRKECVLCKKEIFSSCQIHDPKIMITNPLLSLNEIGKHISEQIFELQTEPDGCFENFGFEKTCWEECDYALDCLRRSGIVPGKACRRFPEVNEKNFKEANLRPTCLAFCKFKDLCLKTLEGIIKEMEFSFDEKKLFTNFYSVNEIRENFIREED